jgi:hypothetical protein
MDGALPVVATLQPMFPLLDHDEKILNNDSITLSVKKKDKMEFKIYFYDLSDWSNIDL